LNIEIIQSGLYLDAEFSVHVGPSNLLFKDKLGLHWLADRFSVGDTHLAQFCLDAIFYLNAVSQNL